MSKPNPAIARPSDTASTTTSQALVARYRAAYEPKSQAMISAVLANMRGWSRCESPLCSKYALTRALSSVANGEAELKMGWSAAIGGAPSGAQRRRERAAGLLNV